MKGLLIGVGVLLLLAAIFYGLNKLKAKDTASGTSGGGPIDGPKPD